MEFPAALGPDRPMPVLTYRKIAFTFAAAVALSASVPGHHGFAAEPVRVADGHATTFVARSDGAEIQSGSLRLRVTAIADDILRVRIAPSGVFDEDSSWAVPGDVRARSVRVSAMRATAAPSAAEFRTAALAVRIEGDPVRLIISDLAGHVISADAPGAIDIADGGFTLRKALPASEHYFGLGDKTGPLDHRGQAFTNWNTDAYHFQESTDPLYKSIPFFVAAGGAAGSYGIFLDNTWRSWFDFGKRNPQVLAFGSSGGPIDYYVIYGPSTPRVIARYADLTGKPPLPPIWALGFQQSRYSYMSAAEVRGVAGRFRRERIPADVLWLDIDYQHDNRPFTTNPRTFADLPALATDLRQRGLRLVAITDLHIAQAPDQGYVPYDSGVAGDHFVKRPDGSLYVGEVWPGHSVFPEFTQSGTRAWWGSLYGDLVAAGIAGFWNDMNEPAVFHTPTKTMPLETQHRIAEPGFAPRTATHEEIHNIYGMQNSRATFDGLRTLEPDERPFVMTRASYAGGQRYAATWTGDNSATWNQLNLAITSLLNLGLSGFAYSGADVGGFIGTPSPALLTKWIEIAAFTPIFRVHSAKDAPPREPWLDGPRHSDIRRRFIEERYRLMPYLYALADENARTGAPLMRPLFYEFPDALDAPCEQPTAFLLGDRLLIAPPPEGESPSAYSVCLPAGGWYDYWTGAKVRATPDTSVTSATSAASIPAAQKVNVTPALDRLPVYVRAGAILPRQPLVQSTADTPQGPLTLDIYPGAGCRGVIYADDGHSMAYEQQDYLRQIVRCEQTDDGIVVDFEARDGGFRPWWRQLDVRVHDWDGPGRASLDGRVVTERILPHSGTLRVTLGDQRGPARLSIIRLVKPREHPREHSSELRWRGRQVSVRQMPSRLEPATDKGGGSRRMGERRAYRFSTTSSGGGQASRLVAEEEGQPYLRSGNTLFDGLFALSVADARLDRVSQIRDDSFNEGRPIDCVCFETGEKWHYVWTRDISYSVDLGLAALDPRRALNSLLFKTSGIRADLLSDRLHPVTVVAQDTGSGGSWPVSTDRVVWIMAASDVLDHLPAAERAAAAVRLYEAARDTVEQDRRFAFDAFAGLYRGETSFLDWREQSYPEWTRNDVSSIAAGYAFSTNVLHAIALQRTARLAEELGDPAGMRYRAWAEDLQRAINARFWQAQSALYASYLTPEPNSVPSNSYDLLGLSLAIIHGIADMDKARQILQHYPVSAAGPPVIWPEQAGIAIYHNRAIWPFVTAYALGAAKVARHADLAGELAESLIRGSALALSNMENFEFLTQQVRFEDGETSGPVINSRRQLWSVAGYLNMVVDTLWGLEIHDGQLSIEPWLPGRLAQTLFGGQTSVSLHDFHVGGASLNVTLELPEAWPSTGWLEPQAMSLNGERVNGTQMDLRRLRAGESNDLRVTMRPVAGATQGIARIPFDDSRQLTPAQRRTVFAPRAPILLAAKRTEAGVILTWQGTEPGATVQIYRNGQLLSASAAGEQFEDRAMRAPGTACYSLTQRFTDTALASLSSRETCVPDAGLIAISSAADLMDGGPASNDGSAVRVIDGIAQYRDWGLPSQDLRSRFTPRASGWYRFELKYANAHGPINTGVTAAVKSVTARCGGDAEQSGSVVMPHLDARSWGYSSGFFFNARAETECELRIADGFNMSYLSHFARYTGGRGGESGALNRADIAAAKIELIRSATLTGGQGHAQPFTSP
jgi:alpha-glucosidase